MSNKNSDIYCSVLNALQDLIEVVTKLRDPEKGCPWDLEQTAESLIPYIVEEAYEVVDAIQSQEQNAIAEELGDLLLQVVLQAKIAQENNYFSLEEVAKGITEKLIRRHPHVFGNIKVNDAEEVSKNWEEIKAKEKGETPEQAQLLSNKLRRYARSLPPLTSAMKISKKAAASGFEWENIEGVWDKFNEELDEFKEALASNNKVHQQEELGDLLFTIINLARWYGLEPNEALQGTNKRFIQRLSLMESLADKPLNTYTIEQLETLWQQAKSQIKHF